MDDVIIKTFFNSLVYKTNRFQVAMSLFSNRSQMTLKCGKNKKVAHEAQPSASLMFLPHFDVICDLLLNRRTELGIYLLNRPSARAGREYILLERDPCAMPLSQIFFCPVEPNSVNWHFIR